MLLQGWRWAWIISGIPGFVLAAVILITVREPVRSSVQSELTATAVTQTDVGWRRQLALICRTFFQPSLLVLCLAGSVRNAGKTHLATASYHRDHLVQECHQSATVCHNLCSCKMFLLY